jgi:hypothetical protein
VAPPAVAASAIAPPGIGRLLGLIGVFIRLGHQYFRELAQPGATATGGMIRYYGTAEVPVILRYLLRGWLRACALSELLRRRALRGQDLGQPARRGGGKPGGGRRGGLRIPAQPPGDIPFAERIPDQEELIAWVRRRSIEAVLAAVARDLALLPKEMGAVAWEKLQQAILERAGEAAQPLIAKLGKLRPIGAAAGAAGKRRQPRQQPDGGEPPGPPAPARPRVLPPVQELLRIAIQTGPPLVSPVGA